MRQIYVLFLALCASVVCIAQEPLSGKFTVNEQGKQVQFAPGNLQYVPSTGEWLFAASQTEIIGKDEAYVTANPGYGGAIDLFPWADNYGEHIGDGWRLLTSEEWAYLLREDELYPGSGPENAGQAAIVTQHGLMILPDGWTAFGELTFSASPNNWTTNLYTVDNWVELEKSGVVFLPCAEEMGMYWSATPNGQSNAYSMYFSETSIAANTPASRTASFSVRLVKDVKETPTDVPTTNDERQTTNKILRNGQIVIVRDGETYTMIGTEVR